MAPGIVRHYRERELGPLFALLNGPNSTVCLSTPVFALVHFYFQVKLAFPLLDGMLV